MGFTQRRAYQRKTRCENMPCIVIATIWVGIPNLPESAQASGFRLLHLPARFAETLNTRKRYETQRF